MKIAPLKLPDAMADYINSHEIDDETEFKRAAFLLYAYIDAGMMSHGYAAELLGVNKFDLIDFYGNYGLSYIKKEDLTKYKESEDEVSAYFDERRKQKCENYRVMEYKEILHEAFAGLLADISKLMSEKGVSSDRKNPLCVLEEKVAAIWREIFGAKYSSMDEMMKLKGQYEFIRSYIEELQEKLQ